MRPILRGGSAVIAMAQVSWPTAALLAVAATLVLAGPSAAIIGGEADGNNHPYAGAIGPRAPQLVASGVLISPTVYLTAGHVILRHGNLSRVWVTFDPVVSDSSTMYPGTAHINPAYDPQSQDDTGDLGVVVLDTPVTGITPAELPTEGLLDVLGPQGLRDTRFNVVGYGVSRSLGGSNGGGKPRPDFTSGGTRKVAQQTFMSLTSAWLRLQQHEDGQFCIGDSGSPSLLGESDVIAGISITIAAFGQCENAATDQRVDTPSARAFLGQYVTLP